MSSEALEEFQNDLIESIYVNADAQGVYFEDSFFEHFCEHLVDAGELPAFERVAWSGNRGARVDGYACDPADADGTLTLIVCDFRQDRDVVSMSGRELETLIKKPATYLKQALDPGFRARLDETTDVFGLSDLIAARWDRTTKIRLLILSNRKLSARVDSVSVVDFEGRPVSVSVWDLGRLEKYVSSGRGAEEIEIDLVSDFGGALPVLPAHLDGGNYEAYLAVVPGVQIAKIYDRYGTRLLEQNVRVFLQARGKVNRQIRDTIDKSPEMFFAYNNGITATAEGLSFSNNSSGPKAIERLRNLQIVNGGQTTASLHAALMRKADLSKVYVQMKLSVIEPDLADEVVPKISEYANSQNKVSATDFFSNHPFHIRIEQFSRRLYAPARDGEMRQTRWFYERARGQYANARALLTPAKRKAFDLEYPKQQKFDKSELAKFVMPWLGSPHIVGRGSQKNFVEFAKHVEKAWEKSADNFNEEYFRKIVAMAIVFRQCERIVAAQPWYTGGGSRAKIVPFAIYRIADEAEKRSGEIDFSRIWKDQSLLPLMQNCLELASAAANDVIYIDDAQQSNRAEYAKNQICTERMSRKEVDWPDEFDTLLISANEVVERNRSARKDHEALNGIQAQMAVVHAGPEFWRKVADWGKANRLLSFKENGILDIACALPGRIPSEKQSLALVEMLGRLQTEGLDLKLDHAPV